MNYVIWKDIKSTDIKGLLISELPPITKPKMRVQETTVDGVDGSIIEELGYESYDKTMLIGLSRGFDIDEVIKYFTGEGQVVFSNEPDKYYNAKIIDRIDYERLLRFKTATVTFRVQPFKYEYQEEEQITATGSIEGTEVKIIDAKATEIKIDGRSTQDGTPTPDTPVDIESVGYENLFDKDNVEQNGISTNGEEIDNLYIVRTDFIEVSQNTKYYLSFVFNGEIGFNCAMFQYDKDKTFIKRDATTTTELELSTEETTKYIRLTFYTDRKITPTTYLEYFSEIQLSTVKKAYIPYGKYGVEVKTKSKNLFNYNDTYYTRDNECSISMSNDDTSLINKNELSNGFVWWNIPVELDKDITISYSDLITTSTNGNNRVQYVFSDVKFTSYSADILGLAPVIDKTDKKVTVTSTAKYLVLMIRASNGATTTLSKLQVEYGTVATDYVPYREPYTSVIPLNAPLRSLPNGVKDIAYIRNNKLYVDRKIKEFVLDGTAGTFLLNETNTNTHRFVIQKIINDVKLLSYKIMNNRFKVFEGNSSIGEVDEEGISIRDNGDGITIRLSVDKVSSIEEFKTWLSENNVEVIYELATPVTEELGDITILELVEGENNISNSENANMIINYIDNKLIINNKGNHTSKPTLLIEGAGTIEMIVNNKKLFNYTFPDGENTVTIDSGKQDAYLYSVLKNRNMMGEFPVLESGENIITWNGLVKGITVSKKSRWL